ncbi:MAG: MFS transporter [Candidatus Heimdallarchaeota archaeon]
MALSSLLTTSDLPKEARGLISKFLILSGLMRTLFLLSSTFYVLFVIDIVGFAELGVLLAVGFILQAIIDYPSGAFADWLGQRWVLSFAYLIHSLAFALLILADSFFPLLFIFVLEAIAKSLESGAIQAWFDNNYKSLAAKEDPKNVAYKHALSRVEMILGIAAGITFITGGIIATLVFRELVFLLQAIGMFFLGIAFVSQLRDKAVTKNHLRENYFQFIKGGVTTVTQNPKLLAFVTGTVLINVVIIIWMELVLMALYFGYTGSDLGAGTLRFIVWITGSLSIGLMGFWTKTLKTNVWLQRIHILHAISFFGMFAALIFLIPFQNSVNLLAICIAIVVFNITGVLRSASFFMRQASLLDLIPNERRSSFYSLVPTLNLLVAAPLVLFVGYIIDSVSLTTAILFLGTIELFGALIFVISSKLPLSWDFHPLALPSMETPGNVTCC